LPTLAEARARSWRDLLLGGRLAASCPRRRTRRLARAGEVFDEPDGERRPAGLVAGAHAPARLAVEVFVEQHQLAPVGALGEAAVAAVTGAVAARAGQEDPREPPRDLARHLGQVQPHARAHRTLD